MLKYLSFFSGIGAFEKAQDNLGIEYELVNYCEIDEHASKSYAAIHGVDESLNLGDITTVDTSKLPNDIDLLTHGSPCQSFSLAGLQHGGDKGSGTQSSLMWETVRIISDIKPKIIIWENVKNVLSKKHKHNFDAYIEQLDKLNYNSYHKILKASDYGIPQARERVFIVSFRKDIDNGKFKFPEPFELKLRLKDLLEDEVDEKYYLTNEQMTKIINWKAQQKPFERVNGKNSIVQTLTARGAGEWHSGMITYCEQCENTTNLQLQVKEATKKGYAEAVEGDSINFEQPNSKTRRGRVGKQVAQTLTTSPQQGAVTEDLRIRKLTPKECWRLMGFDDEDFEKAEKVCSNTQLYKQAGNSIVVDVLEHLFKEIMEVLDMKKVEEVKTITYECDDLIDLALLKEKEPDLYEELLADYPAENATYIFKNKTA